ncbi:hypothetical protein [Methanothermococcus sp.]|uniref:hypothetical protein n=1 Tax=Methanothermococcus sp. TaxID=2614238 RepID=UPI0025EA7401|nr:hypothetical protein [Methanothermococcus sp.]
MDKPKIENLKNGNYGTAINDTITIEITVLCDNPKSKNYELIGREPKNISLYKFFYAVKDIPGSGTFERVKTIPLKKIGEDKYAGTMVLNMSELSKNYTYCVGYPPLNYIDSMNCAIIKLNENRTFKVSVHYWKSLKVVG